MRADGRKADELRQVTITQGYSDFAEGSALIQVGATKVLCTASIEETVPGWMQTQKRSGGWVTGEYAMLPRATHQRIKRENQGPGGRTSEIQRLIGRSLRAAINLEMLGPRTCTIDCDVLQADGGTRTAAITGGYVALALAMKRLIKEGKIPPEVLRSPVAAVSVGIVEQIPLLDLCYAEDCRADVDANIVMNAEGHYIEVQTSAEGSPFTRLRLEELLNLAYRGIGELIAIQSTTIESTAD